jgi:hypothetical protein
MSAISFDTTMPALIIEEIPLYNIVTKPDDYNSGNHGARPDDYYKVLANGNTDKWINSFHTDYSVINIYDTDLVWMREAFKSGSYTGLFPHAFDEEKADMLERYKHTKKYFDGTKYFVRCNSVSLKYGQHGAGPYTTFEQIIESLVTCIKTHTPIDNTDRDKCKEPLSLYLLPWKKFDRYKEYRIFVHNNRITAISQQNLHVVNEFLTAFPEEEDLKKIIKKHVQIVQDSFQKTIKKKITHTSNYCMDAVILEDDSLYFIEINSFGKEYAAGSALFHWLIDEDKLYCNDGNNVIHFRYTA